MAAAYISALVIQHNSNVFICPDGSEGLSHDSFVGKTDVIPSPGAGGVIDGDYYAVPTTDDGIFSGFTYYPTASDATTPPTPQSFHVVRISSSPGGLGSNVWWVRGTSTQYIASSAAAECCDAPVAMPTDVPKIAGCQTACVPDANGDYYVILSLPSISGIQTYFPYGNINGVDLTASTALGYSTPTSLLTFLNTSWTNVGSPASTITWTKTSDNLTIIGTLSSGVGNDEFCINIVAFNPSV